MKVIFKNKVLLRMGLINFLYGAALALFTLRTAFLTDVGLTQAQIGVVFAVGNAIAMVSPLVGSFLADRFRSRYRVYLIAIAGFGIVVTLLPVAGGIRLAGMFLAIFLMPMLNIFSSVGATLVATCSMNATARPDAEGVDYSQIRSFLSVGYMLTNFAFTPIVSGWGTKAGFYIGISFFVGLLLLRRGIRDTETVEAKPAAGQENKRLDWRGIAKNYYIVTFLFANILLVTVDQCFYYLLPNLITESGLPSEYYMTVTGVKVVFEFLLILLVPRLRKVFSLSGLQIIAAASYITEMALQSCMHTLPGILAAELFSGFGNAIVVTTASYYVRVMCPQGLEATAVGLFNMSSSVGGILMSLLFATLIEKMGVRQLYLVGAGLHGAGLMIFVISLLVGKYVLRKKNVVPMLLAGKRTA